MGHDLRKYHRQTTTRLIVGGLIIVFVVGDGLIYLIYGPAAAVSGLICLGTGLLPIAAVILVLEIMGWLAKKAGHD